MVIIIFLTARNGNQTLKFISDSKAEKKIEILLLDLRMPGKDGYFVIKECNKKEIKPVIIVISASVTSLDKAKCKDLGIKYFINKPIELQQLKEVLLYVTAKLN